MGVGREMIAGTSDCVYGQWLVAHIKVPSPNSLNVQPGDRLKRLYLCSSCCVISLHSNACLLADESQYRHNMCICEVHTEIEYVHGMILLRSTLKGETMSLIADGMI